MKKIVSILFIFLLGISFNSCESYLEEEMISDVSSSSYYTTEEGLKDAVEAAYSYLKNQYFAQECGSSLTVFGTDEYANGSDGSHKSLSQYYFDTSESFVEALWESMYLAINQCNAVIGRAEEIAEIDESTKNELVAEARFLRALYYFILIRQYGDVHLTLEETVGVETEANKTSRDIIYSTAIIPDLEYAIGILPESQSDYGRATKGAAQFLLSKAYLSLGWYAGDSDAFEEAVTYAETVINSGTYAMLDNYADIWDIDNQINSEVIWSVQNTTDALTNGNGNRLHLYFCMEYDKLAGMQRSIEYGRPWKRFAPTPYLLSLWDRQYDARYYNGFFHVWNANYESSMLEGMTFGDTAIFIPGVNIGEKYYVADETGNRVEKTLTQEYVDARHNYSMQIYTPDTRNNGEANTGYSEKVYPTTTKFMDPDRADKNDAAGTRDFFVMRLAEAYLIAAEAHFKLGENDEAADMLNEVRKRAAWPGYENDMLISESDVTLDFILEERARELFGEQQRWQDLTRTGTLIERVKLYCNATNSINYAVDNIVSKHLLRPIPQDHIDKCSNDYEQNEGW
jgi:hypothetical protein